MCDSSNMKVRLLLGLLCGVVLAIPANAADWALQRIEGREYVSLDSIATFYGFPKPPAVELTGHVVAAPTPAAATPAPVVTEIVKSDEPAPIGGAEPPAAVPGSKTIRLDSGNSQ